MHITCPNPDCRHDIDLIGTVAIKKEFGLGPNAITTRRDDGRFPQPVLDLGNRLLWVRQDVEQAMAKEAEVKITDFVKGLTVNLQALPEADRERARQRLLSSLAKT